MDCCGNVSIPFKREISSKRRRRPLLKGVGGKRFNSLQTGNFFQTVVTVNQTETHRCQFQFPSNGKLLPNYTVGEKDGELYVWFQFPSNGETSSKRELREEAERRKRRVSIPFKRENFFQTRLLASTPPRLHLQFQFPSNGKLLPNPALPSTPKKPELVSIPFKRETSSKPLPFQIRSDSGSAPPKPNANCATLFCDKNKAQKYHKPPSTLIQTRFLDKTR